jgi:hypothetical protein
LKQENTDNFAISTTKNVFRHSIITDCKKTRALVKINLL